MKLSSPQRCPGCRYEKAKQTLIEMDQFAFEIAKGSWGPDEEFNASFVKKMLDDNGLKPDFTPRELLREWKKSLPRRIGVY